MITKEITWTSVDYLLPLWTSIWLVPEEPFFCRHFFEDYLRKVTLGHGLRSNESVNADSYFGSAEAVYERSRRYPRFALDISVRVFPQNGQRADGRGHDFGRGGMALYVALELALGDEVRLDLVLPYSRAPLSLDAVVRNRQGFRYGVEFVALNPEAEQELQRVTSILQLTAASHT